MMKSLLVAAALIALGGTAIAGEGQGNPFPYQAAPRVYNMQAEHWVQAAGSIDNPYPFAVPGQANLAENMYRPAGSAGEPQSANSLPVGADRSLPQSAAVNSTPFETRTATANR